MTDLILSVPGYVADAKAKIDLSTLERSLQIVSSVKRNSLYLHGDWSVVTDDLRAALSMVEKSETNVTYCVDASEEIGELAALLPDDANIELSITGDTSFAALKGLERNKKLSIFLALEDNESPVTAALSEVLEVYPKPVRISLGVGWKNRLTGPEPIAAEDYQIWADHIVSLVKNISEKSIKLAFYCGLKLCMFDRLQLGELAMKNITWPIATCPRPFLFSVDGKIAPCVRLSLPDSINQATIRDLDETANAVKQWLTPFMGLCYDSETFDCRSLKVASCCTGCLEHSLGGWQS